MTFTEAIQLALLLISIGIAVMLVIAINRSSERAAASLQMIAEVTAETHTLVNKRYGEALMAQVLLARSVARLTTDPDEKAAASRTLLEAEQAYEDHQAKQSLIDAIHPQIVHPEE